MPWVGATSPTWTTRRRHPSRRRAEANATQMNARAVAAWSGACLFIVLFTTNPVYKALVLATAFASLAAGAGLPRMKRVLTGVALIAGFAVALNFVSAHLGRTVLFSLPEQIPAIGGPYTPRGSGFAA